MSIRVKKMIKFVLQFIVIFTFGILEPSLNFNILMKLIVSCIVIILSFLVIDYFFPSAKKEQINK